MSKVRDMLSKKWFKWALALVAVLAIGGFFGFRHWKAKKVALPDYIAKGNGRLAANEVDVATKLPLMVKNILVDEGDIVAPGDVLVQMDSTTLNAELAQANEAVAQAKENLGVAKAAIARRNSEIELARIEKARSKALLEEHAGSKREYDVRSTALKTTSAGLAEEKAKLEVAKQQVKVAEANAAVVRSRIDDATLVSPIHGRVLYRLAEPGEVLAAGGKALTLVDLEDVYMEIFLPADQAASLAMGTEARFILDYAPDRVGVGFVSFVSPEAQFTPKEVETKSEREKLMFRVKIQVPKEMLRLYLERIKTGVRGVGYIKLDDNASWPIWLDRNLVQASEQQKQELEQKQKQKPQPQSAAEDDE